MSGAFSWDFFRELPVVGILRGFGAPDVKDVVAAAARGGLRNVEVTMNSGSAPELLRVAIEAAAGGMNVGAGTVCSPGDLDAALGAGAQFIVTPVVVPEVIALAKSAGVPIIPGAFTPTEIHRAWELGGDLVKVFPAEQLGPNYVRAVKGPFPRIRLLPTGGVTVESLADYHRAGADGYGVGSPLFDRSRVEERDWAWVEEQARRFARAFRSLSIA